MRRSRSSSAAVRDPRQVTSAVHPGLPCQACALCKKGNHSKYFHPKSWKEPILLQQLQQFEPSLGICPDSCICRLCRQDVNKLADRVHGFVPRWRKGEQTVKRCFIDGCTGIDIKVTKVTDLAVMIKFFSCDSERESTSDEVPLCSRHYMEWYRHSHPSHSKCKTCDSYINQLSKSRTIPEPTLLQQFLVKNTEFQGSLSPDDRVCYACYCSHLATLKHIKETVESKDSDLRDLINTLKQTVSTIKGIHTFDIALDYVVRLVAIDVGEALLKQTAMLLPQVYRDFKEQLLVVTKQCGIIVNQDLPSHSWLSSQLCSLLDHHIAYKCSVLKHGTILYRYGGDLFHALSVSLQKRYGQPDNSDSEHENVKENVRQVCTQLNAKCHTQVRKLLDSDRKHPHKIEDFNADSFISTIDKDLWEAVCLLTQPADTRNISHTRKVRRIFILCAMLFTTNSDCSFPLHTLIADIVKTCGGSNRLMKVLNRLGVCASIETHGRYVQYRVDSINSEGPMSGYPQNSFMVVSADNLDYVHQYARSFSGKQSISWHGTTVQIVQPKPTSLTDSLSSTTTGMPHNDTMSQSQLTMASRLYSTRSPQKSSALSSPCPKKARRMRTGMHHTNAPDTTVRDMQTVLAPVQPRDGPTDQLQMTYFLLSKENEATLNKLKQMCEQYILLKVASETHTKDLINLQMYYNLSQDIPAPEPSNIIYYKVIDAKCDNKETLLSIINNLYSEYVLTRKKSYVILEGDQMTYKRIQSIKAEYGGDSSWLIPFVGDWHFLKNYQEVLLKVYFEAGLSELALASKYLPKSIGTNFTRTHLFLLEVWESLFRMIMSFYLEKEAPSNLLGDISHMLQNFPTSEHQSSTLRNLNEAVEEITDKARDMTGFSTFIDVCTTQSQTLQFWCQFLFQDCLAYIALFLAIRSGDWELRVAAMKLMVPLFTSFDRPKYSKLIPHHFLEMYRLPTAVLAHLKKGGFTVSILGRPCHSIGIDEAHEMCINKECKEFITRPSGDYMSRTATFLPVRSKAVKNLEQQIFADMKSPTTKQITSLYTSDPECKKHECNVRAQVRKLRSDSTSLLKSPNGLEHLFKNKELTPQQTHDLMKFRGIGQTEYESRVDYYILRTPSVQPPKHRKSLLTFSEKKTRQKKGSQVEKERKLQLECWEKRVSFSVTTGIQDPMNFQQCIELPRAIATTDGKPVKGAKSNTTKWFEHRYEKASVPIITTSLPPEWTPDSVVMEGMFLININPWSAHKTIGDYGDFLLRQHILPHYRTSTTTDVHLLFDDPECQQYSPKYFERLHRDKINAVPSDHCCTDFSSDMMIPPKWRENVLNCRKCKRQLVCFLSTYFINKVKPRLRHTQRFITAGGLEGPLINKALCVTNGSQPHTDDTLACNAEESDTRIWLHVLHSAGTKKLVLSPDTDVYHIGLPVVVGTHLDVIVRLSLFSALELRLLNLQALITAFENDPDLAGIARTDITRIIQMLFIITGCDFVSFFNGLGKATFLNTLFEYSRFINANSTDVPGTLSMTSLNSDGLLSFLRLVGCAYFKKHKSGFLPSFPTPVSLYNSITSEGNTLTRHSKWLSTIRDRIWSRIQYEEDMLPSCGALSRHWKRACWVSSVWSQATANVVQYPPLGDYGWKQPQQNTLTIEWDSDSNLSEIKERVGLIRKGCSCKTGCKTARCKCRKKTSHCGPGCKCIGCTNLPLETDGQPNNDADCEDSSDESSATSDLEGEVDQLMADVFGTDTEGGDVDSGTDLNI